MGTIQAVIFDLDGVIVSTDDCHFEAWKVLAEREHIPFTREDNRRQRGVSRMESLEILLEKASKTYSADEKAEMAEYKNDVYKQLIRRLTPADILPGAMETLRALKAEGVKVAIGSSSKNTPVILERIGLGDFFDAVADGNQITRSKPDPEVFLLAARLVGALPEDCVVVEDADAGIEAAHAGGMKALAVGSASHTSHAEWKAENLTQIDLPKIMRGGC